MSSRNKALRIDSTRLSLPDDLVLLCIPYWFRFTLLELTDRLLWSRVWKDETGEEIELTEQQKSRIEYAIYRLSTETPCQDLIEDAMTINIENNPIFNNNSGGGSGTDCCGTSPNPWENVPWPGGTPNYPVPPINPPITSLPPVPPPGTTDSEWDIYRCKAANYAHDQIAQWLQAVANVPGSLVAIGTILLTIWAIAPLGLLAIIGVGVLELASVIFSWYALSEGIDEIAEYAGTWWAEHEQDIVCQLYDMTDPTVAHSSILTEFLDDLATWAEERPWWSDSLLDMLQNVGGHIMPLQIFLAPWELVPEVGYVGNIDCSLCGESTPTTPEDLPVAPEGYMWIPAEAARVTFVPNNSTANGATDGAGVFTHAPNPPQNYHEVAVHVDIDGVLLDAACSNAMAMAVRVQQYGAAGQQYVDGLRLSSNTGGALDLLAVTNLSTWWYHYSADGGGEVTGLAVEFDGSSTYGNGAMSDTKASLESRTYGTVAPASMVYDVWYLAEI